MMGFLGFCSVKLLLFVIFLSFVASMEPSPTKASERRGLRNVIRVGKRYGEDELWDFLLTEDKRHGKLMAFPRVGRSSSSWAADDSPEKRSAPNTGMWFGPRIGRSPPKINNDPDDSTAWTYILLNKENPLTRHFLSSNQQLDAEPEESNEYPLDEFKEIVPSY